MSVVDDSGRLFGRINVVDAAVVLMIVVAVVGAGVVFLDPFGAGAGDGGEPATRYATIDLGERSPSTASQITEGDTSARGESADSSEGITVTDTYVGPGAGANASVVVRVRIDGTTIESDDGADSSFEYADERLRRGSDLTIDTTDYTVRGELLQMEASGDSLQTDTQSVLVRSTVDPTVATAVEEGDRYRLGDRTVATVDEVVVASGVGPNRSALLGLSLETISRSGNVYFGDRRLLVGRTVDVHTARYELSGPVTQWATDAGLPEPTTRTAVVKVADVPPEIADGVEAGMVERREGAAIASVERVRTEPASVVLTSDDGNVCEREHPRNLDVYLTVELQVRSTDDGLEFRLEPLRDGSSVRLDFRTVVVEGTVTDVGP